MTHRDEILPPSADIVIEALESTRDLIERGHCKGQAHTVIEDTDLWDIMGALAKSCNTIRIGDSIIPGKSIYESAVAALKIAMSPRWSGSLSEFNDASSTDAVVNLCNRAIGIVRQAAA